VPATELTVMIFRERCCFIIGATALQLYTVPNRFISVTSCRSAGSRLLALVSIGRPPPPPAFATRTSTRPHSWTTRATIASTASCRKHKVVEELCVALLNRHVGNPARSKRACNASRAPNGEPLRQPIDGWPTRAASEADRPADHPRHQLDHPAPHSGPPHGHSGSGMECGET
jgi:hypothetical protein